MSEDNKALNALLDGISLMIDEKLKLAGFDRSVVGFITGTNLENNTYTVKINGYEYENVKSVVGDLNSMTPCICTIPQNQMSQMYISGIIDTKNYIDDGGGGTGDDYNELNNKPSINGVTLIGNKTASDLGISQPTKTSQLTNDSHFIVDANYVHTDNNFTNALLSKLNGIEDNAQVNIIEAIKVNNVTQPITDKTVNLTISASGMYYGSCATSANVNSKLVTIPSAQSFELKIGAVIGVKFTNTNTYSASAEYPITLNVNSTGAKNIYYADSGNPLGDNPIAFGRADYINYYQYDGTYWIWCGSSSDDGVDYDVITANEISTGTDTTPKVVRADYLKAGIQAIVNAMSLGHTIWNKIKTALTKRPNLWFKDAYVTDDSTNDSTNIEVIQTVTEAQWENLATTDDGFYDIDNGTALPLTADLIAYDNTSSGLIANEVQSAIDELAQGAGGGGHVIQDADGTDLTQRDTLQFKGGLNATDDSTNQKTVVDGSPTEMTWSEYNALTPAQQASLEHTLITDVPGADATISADLMTKLWENSELSGVGNLSAFGAQTVALDLSEYDFVLVDTMYYARADRDSYIVPKGTVNFRMCHSQATNTSGYYLNIATRNVQMTDTGVAFGDCTYAHDSTAATTENLYMIPVRIYGIKKTVTVTFDALAKNVSTSASKCMMSDEETSVEDAIEDSTTWELIDTVSVTGGSGVNNYKVISYNSFKDYKNLLVNGFDQTSMVCSSIGFTKDIDQSRIVCRYFTMSGGNPYNYFYAFQNVNGEYWLRVAMDTLPSGGSTTISAKLYGQR